MDERLPMPSPAEIEHWQQLAEAWSPKIGLGAVNWPMIVKRLIAQNADLTRQVTEVRGAIDALLQPAPSELLSKNFTHPSRAPTSDRQGIDTAT